MNHTSGLTERPARPTEHRREPRRAFRPLRTSARHSLQTARACTIAGGFFSGAFHLWDNCRCAPCGFEIYCRSVAPCNRNGTTPWNNIEALCKKHAAEHRCWRLMRVRGSLLKHTACFERPAAKRHGFGSQVCFWRLAGLPLQWSHALARRLAVAMVPCRSYDTNADCRRRYSRPAAGKIRPRCGCPHSSAVGPV